MTMNQRIVDPLAANLCDTKSSKLFLGGGVTAVYDEESCDWVV